jgi:hypothetical protein
MKDLTPAWAYKAKQRFVMKMLDTVLAQASR